jgi:murein DD-endopeptidase MepM/ murein hydrolase activator NlpD
VSGGVASLAAGGEDPRVIEARGAIEDLRRHIDLATDMVDGLEARVSQAGHDLTTLGDEPASAEVSLRDRHVQLDRRSRLASEVVTTGRTPGRPEIASSLAELKAPLRIVSRAIHASDELAIELLQQRDDVSRRSAAVHDLLAEIRRTSFDLEMQERSVHAQLTDAMASAHDLAEVAADPALRRQASSLIARAREELHMIDVAAGELRQRQTEALEASVTLDERAGKLRSAMREAKRTTDDLYSQMAVAEVIVSSRLDAFRPLWAPTVALDGALRVCPVGEPYSYIDTFGAPRWAGGFHLHQGADIFAPEGTPIYAPFDGIAVTADNTLGGTAVKVLGKVGYVYNAHLSAYGKLGPVKAGDIVGFVGNTGDAINSAPHDHFEFHPGNGDAVDPFAYLNAVC